MTAFTLHTISKPWHRHNSSPGF